MDIYEAYKKNAFSKCCIMTIKYTYPYTQVRMHNFLNTNNLVSVQESDGIVKYRLVATETLILRWLTSISTWKMHCIHTYWSNVKWTYAMYGECIWDEIWLNWSPSCFTSLICVWCILFFSTRFTFDIILC